MGDLVIKPEAGGSIKLQNNAGTNALVSDNSGNITLAGNTTLGTVAAGTLGTAVTGDAFKNGTCYFKINFSSDIGWSNLGANVNIPWTNIAVDGDNCCSATGGNEPTIRFTAPADGVYVFWFSVYSAQTNQKNAFTFAIDDSRSGTAQSTDFGSGSVDNLSAADQSISMTRVLELTANKFITVQTSVASDAYSGHSSWGGCRIG